MDRRITPLQLRTRKRRHATDRLERQLGVSCIPKETFRAVLMVDMMVRPNAGARMFAIGYRYSATERRQRVGCGGQGLGRSCRSNALQLVAEFAQTGRFKRSTKI